MVNSSEIDGAKKKNEKISKLNKTKRYGKKNSHYIIVINFFVNNTLSNEKFIVWIM